MNLIEIFSVLFGELIFSIALFSPVNHHNDLKLTYIPTVSCQLNLDILLTQLSSIFDQ